MPVYNGAAYLAKSIESILDQSFKNFEFIIINDGSTDNSPNIINNYSSTDRRIVLINNSKNLGLTKSLNIGLKISKGAYIARMDSDDIAFTNRLEKQYEFLEKNKKIFLLGSGATKIDINGKALGDVKLTCGLNNIRDKLVNGNCLIHPTIFFRNHHGVFYREKFFVSQDYDFYLNLLTKKLTIENYRQPLIYHRILNEESISNKKLKLQVMLKMIARAFYFERIASGVDSYERFDFQNINEIIKYLNIDEAELDRAVIKQSVLSLLQKGEYSSARNILKDYRGDMPSKILLTLMAYFPYTYRWYRFLRYSG